MLSGFPEPIQFIANGTILGVPFGIVVFALCAVPVAVMLHRTPFGNAIYMMGSKRRLRRASPASAPSA